jgi:histidinol-phosphatase (PHP family)
MEKDGEYYSVDYSLDASEDGIKKLYGGDAMEMVKAYYALVARLPERGSFDILGHFDLLTKFQEKKVLFDEKSREYMAVAVDAMESVRGKIPFFEVNTGAIARGYRTSPYPQMEFLKEFNRCGFGVVITSDCHNKTFLDCFYKEAADLVAQAGFRSKWILTGNGFREVAL